MAIILKRYLTCTKCNKKWNVSIKSLEVNSSYVCPRCEERRQANGKNNASYIQHCR